MANKVNRTNPSNRWAAFKSLLSKGLDIGLNYIFDPVFFISFLGPIVVGSSYFMIMHRYNDPSSPEYLAVQAAAANPYTYALISYNIQYFVLIVAFVFLLTEAFLGGWKLITSCPMNKLQPLVKESMFTKGIILFTAILVVLIVVGLVSTFPHIDINLYLKSREVLIPGTEHALPPFSSPITIYRIMFAIYGLLFARWKSTVLPELIAAANGAKKDDVLIV